MFYGTQHVLRHTLIAGQLRTSMSWDASSFNQPLGAWAVRPEANTSYMFDGATAFDRAANAPWYT